jgi:hypothetical protein
MEIQFNFETKEPHSGFKYVKCKVIYHVTMMQISLKRLTHHTCDFAKNQMLLLQLSVADCWAETAVVVCHGKKRTKGTDEIRSF